MIKLKEICVDVLQYWLEYTILILLFLTFVSLLTSFIMWEFFFIIDFFVLRIVIVIGLIYAVTKEYKSW